MPHVLQSVVQRTAGSDEFTEIQNAENVALQARRTKQNKDKSPVSIEIPQSSDKAIATLFRVFNTVGLSLSGGGIRSAAFCLGVLQAINQRVGLNKVDYMSTCSGGGYVGASVAATTALTSGKFAFASSDDFSDQAALGHLRNYSNYLLPRGDRTAFIKSLTVLLRGLVTNIALTITVAFACTAIIVWAYPSRSLLHEKSFVPAFLHLSGTNGYLTFPLWVFLFLTAFLLFWALLRSITSRTGSEVGSPFATIAACLIILVAFLAWLDLQPFLISKLFDLMERPDWSTSTFKYITSVIGTVTGAAAFFSGKLGAIIKISEHNRTMRAAVQRLAATAFMWIAAAMLPLFLWLCFLLLEVASIRDDLHDNNISYPLANWLFMDDGTVLLLGVSIPIFAFYIMLFVILAIITAFLKPNANSLHRIYRDRLSTAFIFDPRKGDPDRPNDCCHIENFKLSDIAPDSGGPYLIINAALNVQNSKEANRRGRNADFFQFTSQKVGSDTTGYVATKIMQDADPDMDLATAMAISGAAVSSNMGARSIRAFAPTLALLNIRLGYWLQNPRFAAQKRGWRDILRQVSRSYIVDEMLGLLDENRRSVYVTDGGHIENLAVYQLLKRGCRVIVAVDGEQDPGLAFAAFATLQRYARIDLGITIDLPLHEISTIGKELSDAADAGRPLPSHAGPHCALGHIYYPNGITGLLFYIKSSISGDEPDYVLDYKRRYPAFPHETTGDQFFSEEQFEAYRALGFHTIDHALTDTDKVACVSTATLDTLRAAIDN